jgi:hypothetical protein
MKKSLTLGRIRIHVVQVSLCIDFRWKVWGYEPLPINNEFKDDFVQIGGLREPHREDSVCVLPEIDSEYGQLSMEI